ncbi:MAG: nickel-dependent lactate racemase, partial [Treponema sp.]|nr:nickel-dependent lactate racemase [Treponema sp.]
MTGDKTFAAKGGVDCDLSDEELLDLSSSAFSEARSLAGTRGPFLILPPDITRLHSRAGFLAAALFRTGADALVMPALGSHAPMTEAELSRMFPGIPPASFRIHNWRNDVVELGCLDADWVERTFEGAVRYDWPV